LYRDQNLFLRICFEFVGSAFLTYCYLVHTDNFWKFFALFFAITAASYLISGANYNPAISLALALKGSLSWKEFAGYALGQILGSCLSGFLCFVIDKDFAVVRFSSTNCWEQLAVGVSECFFLTLLVLVYLTQTVGSLALTQSPLCQCLLTCLSYLALLVISHVSLSLPPCLNPALAVGASVPSVAETEAGVQEVLLVYVLPASPISAFLGFKVYQAIERRVHMRRVRSIDEEIEITDFTGQKSDAKERDIQKKELIQQ